MSFSDLLLQWYKLNKRDLPWRQSKEAYSVWLSEIILQQTRVAQGMPYYLKIIDAFPNVQALACSEEKDILSLWQGLGYYSRGRNLHRCANQIVNDYDGNFPHTSKELQKLTGVGKYTSAAIASICFNEVIPVIDGNVYRVISRYFDIDQDISASKAYGVFENILKELISQDYPGDFNQAIMEFGALQCTPKNPKCNVCPLREGCIAFHSNLIEKRPVKSKKIKVKKRFFNYLVIIYKQGLWFKERPKGDIWTGLFDFPLQETDSFELPPDDDFLLELCSNQIIEHDISTPIKHVLTHQIIQARFRLIELNSQVKESFIKKYDLKWFSFVDVEELPKPVLISNYLKSEPKVLALLKGIEGD